MVNSPEDIEMTVCICRHNQERHLGETGLSEDKARFVMEARRYVWLYGGERMPVEEFFLTIVIARGDEHIYNPVFESLDKINGITGRSISIGTNCMTASAKWEASGVNVSSSS